MLGGARGRAGRVTGSGNLCKVSRQLGTVPGRPHHAWSKENHKHYGQKSDKLDAREQIFQQLLEDCGGGIARLAGSYVRSTAEREDLIQEIWLAIWRALPGFRGESSLRTFVYRIAHNRSVTQLARRHDSDDSDVLDTVVDERPGPEAQLVQSRDAERLTRAVSMLPLGMRQVLTLRFEGLSYSEISEVVGISESNVAVRLNRARERLNTKLTETV